MESSSNSPEEQEPWEYILRKYVLMLATLVATVAYDVGFNPPGGVWQDTNDAAGHLAGEPIVWTTNGLRYLVFFYCNATAFVSSILVIVLFLLLSIQIMEKNVWIRLKPLRVLMVLDLLSFMAAFAAGTCRDMPTTVYTSVLMAAAVLTYLTVQMALVWRQLQSLPSSIDLEAEGRLRKVLMLLSTFAVSITYVAGLNSPGGFWDNTEGSHRAGDAILNAGHHKARLATFSVCDTTAFVASLLIIMLLLGRKLHERTVRSREMYGCILLALVGLVGAYATGSSREVVPTAYVLLVISASLVCACQSHRLGQMFLPETIRSAFRCAVEKAVSTAAMAIRAPHIYMVQRRHSRSLLLLLATFATAITYQAGLAPPGGVWQDNRDSHIVGDPILLTINATRYKTFLYCNSFAFAASLVSILLVMMRLMPEHHIVESVMIVELFGLIGAYAAGACREVTQYIYVMALAGAVLFYVVIHVIFFSLEQVGTDFYVELVEVEKKRKLLYLFATLSTAMSYQAGLTPPGGFWLQDEEETQHYAGNPVLLYHHPHRYNAFFYCNSVSFMLSVTTMILLVSPVLYKPAIRSYALPLCTVASLFCLMGAYAAGCTHHQTTSVGIYFLVALAFLILVVLLVTCLVRDYQHRNGTTQLTTADEGEHMTSEERIETKRLYAHMKYLMLLAILVAGVTYQAGIDPPGGLWQSGDGHDAGNPVMLDNIWRRQRYLVFFYSNSTSFATSIVIILLLLLQWSKGKPRQYMNMLTKIVLLTFLALLVAYAAGSNRDWKSSMFVAALIIPLTRLSYGQGDDLFFHITLLRPDPY